MRGCEARKATPHAGCVSGTNGSGYWGGRPRASTDGSGPGGQPAWQGGRWGQCSADGWLGHARAFQISPDQQGLLCSEGGRLFAGAARSRSAMRRHSPTPSLGHPDASSTQEPAIQFAMVKCCFLAFADVGM